MRISTILPVIMAGGTGSRLWPLSRELYPKQFICLQGEYTMLQTTIRRLDSIKCESPLVVCNEEHRFIVAEQLRQLDKLTKNIVLEPVGRNTAPAIAISAFAAKLDVANDPLLLVLPADHVIENEKEFCSAVQKAVKYADAGKLVTFGIIPNKPETGYGYIKRGGNCGDDLLSAFEVAEFVEKPDHRTAQDYVTSGEYYWNSGMFLFRAGRYLEELKKYRPDILEACESAMSTIDTDLDFIRVDEKAFFSCPAESIDYAVMEHTQDAVVVPLNNVGWSDVGSWASLWEVSEKDSTGNVNHGDVISINTEDSFIYAESGLVATVGIKNIIIVQTKDATLVINRNAVQDVKKVVEKIKYDGRHEHHIHREVYRPWGKYDSIDSGSRYQVKRITIKPGEGMVEQMHLHRTEHWVVVAGTAKATIDNEVVYLSENESIYIPIGVKHSLENPGKIPLYLIEVRSGAYLEEDDIVRFQERYGRSNV